MIAQPQTALRSSSLAVTDLPKERSPRRALASVPPAARPRRALTGLVQIFTCAHRNYFTHVMADALRNAGQGKPTLVVQFLKGGCHQGPGRPMQFGKMLDWFRCGLEHCINATPQPGEPQTEASLRAVQELWQFTHEAIASGRYDAVVLDELSLAIVYGLVDEAEVVDCLRSRPSHIEVTLTGQSMPKALLQMADQVTELRNVFKTVIPEPSVQPAAPIQDLTPRIKPIPSSLPQQTSPPQPQEKQPLVLQSSERKLNRRQPSEKRPEMQPASAPLMQLGLNISGIAAATPHQETKPVVMDIHPAESKPKPSHRSKTNHRLQQITIPGLE